MPKVGGPAAAVELRGRFAALPILLTSGYSEWIGADELANCDHLRKPYRPTVLVRLLRKILDSADSENIVSGEMNTILVDRPSSGC